MDDRRKFLSGEETKQTPGGVTLFMTVYRNTPTGTPTAKRRDIPITNLMKMYRVTPTGTPIRRPGLSSTGCPGPSVIWNR